MKLITLFFFVIIMPILSSALIISAHRGASGYELENTLHAFKRAIDMGAPIVELDVQKCSTGELIVFHNDVINQKNITELTWNTLKKIDLGNGERIPLLGQVLDLVDKQVIVNIELKGKNTAKPVADLITQYICNKNWKPDHFIIASFDHYSLRDFKKYHPSIKTAVLFEGNPIGYADIAQRANAHYAFMHYQWINKELINDAHKKNIKIFAYTVNSKSLAHRLQKLNIDGIITDYPDLMTLDLHP